MQLLPIEILDWFPSKSFNLGFNSNFIPIGCFLAIYSGYVNEFYDSHNYYPLDNE